MNPLFKKYIENDAALERRFQQIMVREPTLDDTVAILRGLKTNYEHYHRIAITDDALLTAARLAEQYISNKFLPDKAIDLLDETAAAKRLTIKNSAGENKLHHLELRLEKIISTKETAALNDKFDEAVKLKKEEEKIKEEIRISQLLEKPIRYAEITEKDILLNKEDKVFYSIMSDNLVFHNPEKYAEMIKKCRK